MKKLFYLILLIPAVFFTQTKIEAPLIKKEVPKESIWGNVGEVKQDTLQKVLPEGTIVQAELLQDLNGKDLSIGQTIDFSTRIDIWLGTRIVIPSGTKIKGTITEAKGSRMLGKKGKLAFSIDYIYLSDGRVFKLRGQITKQLEGSGALVAGTAVLLTPFALLINGRNAKFKKGDYFDVYLDQDITF